MYGRGLGNPKSAAVDQIEDALTLDDSAHYSSIAKSKSFTLGSEAAAIGAGYMDDQQSIG